MRRIAWLLLHLFVFTIPWEYSLVLRDPWGNIARIAGLLTLLAVILATLAGGRVRRPGPLQIAVLAFFLWLALTCFWSIDPAYSFAKLRGYFQEMMIVFLVWQMAESPDDLRSLLRAYVAGSWVLAGLSVAGFAMADSVATQIRFTAEGQDPNDVARFLNLGFPLAALLFGAETHRLGRILSIGYLPVGIIAVVLSASRGGFLVCLMALAGCGLLLVRTHARALSVGSLSLLSAALCVWMAVPSQTLGRILTISEQLNGGDFNQRFNIWWVGWHAFLRAPFAGQGAGAFVASAGLAPFDTAHNTALSLLVTGGLCALFLACAIVAVALVSVARLTGPLRLAFLTSLLVWLAASSVATVEESRTTWLLFSFIALAARLAAEDAEGLVRLFIPRAEARLVASPADA